MGYQPYRELAVIVEAEGGEMYFERKGQPLGGAWFARLPDGPLHVFYSNRRGFPDLDCLYLAKVRNPQHYNDYTNDLRPDAKQIWLDRLRSDPDAPFTPPDVMLKSEASAGHNAPSSHSIPSDDAFRPDAAPGAPWPPTAPRPISTDGKPVTQEWERTYAMAVHLLLIAGHVIPVVPSLILWLIKRDQSPFVDDHGKEAVNFQISIVIYMVIGGLLAMICIGFAIMAAAYILAIIGMILAAIAANRGEFYRYPATLRLIP